MYLKIFYALLFGLLTSACVQQGTLAGHETPQKELDRLEKELDRLQKEQTQILPKWQRSGQEHRPSLQSPLVSSESLSQGLPHECVTHLAEETAKLEQGGYSKQAWLHHVFECERCCAPLLADVMDMHVSHVISNPHIVVLFDFDKYMLTDSYRQRLDAFMPQLNPRHDQLLLIGRASQIGSKDYNIALSGRRAGEIKDYVMDKFSVADDRISYLFFGADPPQLTLDNAIDYGITAKDITTVDTNLRNRAENKINQSVVVIIYKNSDDAAKPHTTAPHVVHNERHEARESTQVQVVSKDAPGRYPDTVSVPEVASPSIRGRKETVPLHLLNRMMMVTEAPASTSFRFGLDIIRIGRHTGLDMVHQQSGGGIDTIERLLDSENAAVGIVPSNMSGIMSQSPDAKMNRLAEQLHLLFPLHHEEVHLLARQGIHRVEDLDGKRIIVGVPGSRTWLTAYHLLRKLKVQPGVLINAVSPLKAVVAVLQGTADAMFYVGETPALPFIHMHDLLGDARFASFLQDVNFVPLNAEQGGPEYTASVLGPQDYKWVKTTVPTLAIQMVLASFDASTPTSRQDDRYCGQLVALTQAVRENFAVLQRSGHSKWQEVALDDRLAAWKYHSCTRPEMSRQLP